jgi:hypothetical protein
MEVSRIIAEIDAQIAKLQQARELLSGTAPKAKGPGRPKGSKNAPGTRRRRHKLSAEGRRRISESQKRRWAEQRKASSKTSSK